MPPPRIPPQWKHISVRSKTNVALHKLRELELLLFEMICTLLEPLYLEFTQSRNAFFRHDSAILPCLLSLIYNDTIGQNAFMNCLPPATLQTLFCERISCQMEEAKPFFHMSTKEFSLEFLENFDLQKDVEGYANGHLDDWMAVLNAATGGLNSETKAQDMEIGHLVMTCQAMNLHSLQCAQLPYMLGQQEHQSKLLKF
ncbi:hypothetical protein BDP27DRAFT_1419740 [Rhodocollybia butyracea]|uniref:Uncharacterized protein n=1 Tax=Rhodocollybia butyracea TaxID=206335 RepID=A0A9P5U975_9AGAR|nr:hypothetical protein BDP27DRAFT_1419740 [Rhodocollybia butyracea]